jgi:diguanylate cyclase (GGDEF)-like protein
VRERITATDPSPLPPLRSARSVRSLLGSLRSSWHLPRPVRIVVGAVSVGYLAVLVVGLLNTRYTSSDAGTFALFTVASILSVEVSLRLAWPRPRRDRISRDFLGVWALPVMLLLPPAYAAAAVLLPSAYVQWRAWRTDPVKVFYTTAALGIARAAGSATHIAIGGSHPGHLGPADLLGSGRQQLAVVAAIAVWWVVNYLLIGAVVALTVGYRAVLSALRDLEGQAVDVVDTSMGLLATIAFALRPEFVVIAAAPVLYMQHQAFSGLRSAVRTDLLTEAASAQYWRDTADREVQRARASGTNVAVLMVDIDHFKQVNDRYGHIAGDAVLTAIARTIATTLRPADLVGRLGGEEFAAVLTGSTLVDAEAAAQRVRTNVAAVRVRTDRGEWVSVTVSAGVAALGVHGRTLAELLAASDGALYVAKDAGRNAVRVAAGRPSTDLVIDLTNTPLGFPGVTEAESAGSH